PHHHAMSRHLLPPQVRARPANMMKTAAAVALTPTAGGRYHPTFDLETTTVDPPGQGLKKACAILMNKF
ncbi:hypothetical protein, partial [Mycobacterium sp. 852002-40037_SCH5390672]|uniref:hypothetical protein n=1 Tax=Mycobacterium sp. 852002-40037_SCH5390672 TaxID=1834089 RepID=UPI001E5FBC9B